MISSNYLSLYTLATSNNTQLNKMSSKPVYEESSFEAKNGFMTSSFNQLAEIPENIHISEKIANDIMETLRVSNSGISIADFMHKSWQLFSLWTGENSLNDSDGYINMSQFKNDIPGVIYLDKMSDQVKTDSVKSVQQGNYLLSGVGTSLSFYNNINTSFETPKQGFEFIRGVFEDYSGGRFLSRRYSGK